MNDVYTGDYELFATQQIEHDFEQRQGRRNEYRQQSRNNGAEEEYLTPQLSGYVAP